jgi:integrase
VPDGSGPQAARSDALESEPITPVNVEDVTVVNPHVTRQVWAMIQLQLLTAARRGEVRMMRTRDFFTTTTPWEYHPDSHKTQLRGRSRVIFLGGRAQEVVRRFLKPDNPDEHIFSPAEARVEFNAKRSAERKTPMTPSQRARQRKSRPGKQPGKFYIDCSIGRAITVACVKAGVIVYCHSGSDERSPQDLLGFHGKKELVLA